MPFRGCPACARVEYPANNGGSASPPAGQRFVVAVEDQQRRFLPVVMRVDAPFTGIYPTALAASPPGEALPGFYLFLCAVAGGDGLGCRCRADLVREFQR